MREHVISAPLGQTWEANLRALTTLGFVPAETDPERGFVASEFRSVDGNSARDRSRGIARVAVERDVYAAGRARMLLNLSSLDAERTLVRLVAEVQAKVERRGEIRYDDVQGSSSPLPLFTAWTTAKSEDKGSEWESLTSNGVLEDEFIGALAGELAPRSAPER